MKKNTIIAAIIALLVAISIFVTVVVLDQPNSVKTETSNESTTSEVKPVADDSSVTYAGVEGKTALELLKSSATVETSGEGEMAFVTSINGVSADSSKNQFWSFNVNGTPASVGAGSYVTGNTDTITWKLDTF